MGSGGFFQQSDPGPLSSSLRINRISKPALIESGPAPSLSENQNTSSKTEEQIQLTDKEHELLSSLPPEIQSQILNNKELMSDLHARYNNGETEVDTSPAKTSEPRENPYEKLQQMSAEELKKFDPRILPEGENNPYRKLLQN